MLLGIWCAKVIFGFTQIYGLTHSGFQIDSFFGVNKNLLHIGWPLVIVTATVIAVRDLRCQDYFCLQKTLRFWEVGDSQKWLHPHPTQS